jgi:small subunit ribosomal protein S13
MSRAIANILQNELHIDPSIQVGKLTEDQVEKIDKILFDISKYALPSYLFNRRSDSVDGSSKHLIMSDLLFSFKQDVEKEKKLYTWKGYRHAYGQKVRGQRTRNTGRTGMAVGVLRKAVLAAQKAAVAAEAKPGRPGAPAGGAAAPAGSPAAPAAGKAPAPAAKAEKAAPKAAEKPAGKPAEKK